jgi:hypothetical protein
MVIQPKEYAEASSGKKCMRGFPQDVVIRNAFEMCEAIVGQKFFDRKVGKLDNVVSVDVDNGDQCGTGRQQGFLCILGAPPCVKRGICVSLKSKGEDLRKLLGTKWAHGYGQALK